jgi:hypothetical protein
VAYPSKFSFSVSVPSLSTDPFSFSVDSLFGYLRPQYSLLVKNLNYLALRDGAYYLDLPSAASQQVSVVIIDLFKHRYPKLFRYLGYLRLTQESVQQMGYPLHWEAYDESGITATVFHIHSFKYEFKYLAKYFVSHLNKVSFRNGQFGFYNWFNHWISIQDVQVVNYFKSLVQTQSSSSSSHGTIVTKTHHFTVSKPKVHVFRTAPKVRTFHTTIAVPSSSSSSLSGGLNVKNLHHLFNGLQNHFKKHGHSFTTTKVYHGKSAPLSFKHGSSFHVNPHLHTKHVHHFIGDNN